MRPKIYAAMGLGQCWSLREFKHMPGDWRVKPIAISDDYTDEEARRSLNQFIGDHFLCQKSHLLGDISELKMKLEELLAQSSTSNASTTSKEQQSMGTQEGESVTPVEAHCLSTLSRTELEMEALTCFALLLTKERGWESLLDLKSKLEELDLSQVKSDFKIWSETSEDLRLKSEEWMTRLMQLKE